MDNNKTTNIYIYAILILSALRRSVAIDVSHKLSFWYTTYQFTKENQHGNFQLNQNIKYLRMQIMHTLSNNYLLLF